MVQVDMQGLRPTKTGFRFGIWAQGHARGAFSPSTPAAGVNGKQIGLAGEYKAAEGGETPRRGDGGFKMADNTVQDTAAAAAELEEAKAEVAKLKKEAEAAKKEAAKLKKTQQESAEGVKPQQDDPTDPKRRVKVRLFKDNNKYKEPLYVSVNGYNAQIPRGVVVEVPYYVAKHIEEMQMQDENTSMLIEIMTQEYAQRQERLN